MSINFLSAFQLLPYHVVKLIVGHVAGSSRLQSDGVSPASAEYREIIFPLLWTCHNFRAVVLPLCCSRFKLDIDTVVQYREYDICSYLGEDLENRLEGVPLKRLNSGDPSNVYFGYPTYHMVKELDIKVGEEAVYSGLVKRVLSHTPYDGCAFPQACALWLQVVLDAMWMKVTGSSQETEANIFEFVQWIKIVAPGIDAVRISFEVPEDVSEAAIPNLNYLVSQLYRLVKHVEYVCCCDEWTSVDIQFDAMHGLAHIESICARSSNQFVQLARHSSLVLQTLNIVYMDAATVSSLILNPDGDYITYRRLHTLKLQREKWENEFEEPDDDPLERQRYQGAIPFPELRSLHLINGYPFDDDTPFRGNEATLEFLDMELDSKAITDIIDCNVFTPTSHLQLKHVNTRVRPDDISDSFDTSAEAVQFIFSIGPSTHIRVIGGFQFQTGLVPAISLAANCACIQVLSLPNNSLDLWDAVTLIKALPLLTDLHTLPPTLGLASVGVAEDNLATYMATTLGPISKQFRCWHFVSYKRRSGLRDVAKCVLLLALACPNFTYASPARGMRKPFMEAMEDAIALSKFKDYDSRLQCFLFYGWELC